MVGLLSTMLCQLLLVVSCHLKRFSVFTYCAVKQQRSAGDHKYPPQWMIVLKIEEAEQVLPIYVGEELVLAFHGISDVSIIAVQQCPLESTRGSFVMALMQVAKSGPVSSPAESHCITSCR